MSLNFSKFNAVDIPSFASISIRIPIIMMHIKYIYIYIYTTLEGYIQDEIFSPKNHQYIEVPKTTYIPTWGLYCWVQPRISGLYLKISGLYLKISGLYLRYSPEIFRYSPQSQPQGFLVKNLVLDIALQSGIYIGYMVFFRAISTNIAPQPRIFSSSACGLGRKNPRFRGYIADIALKNPIYP